MAYGSVNVSQKVDNTELIKQILLLAYPVGSYYWSNNSTDPANLFGGTWTQIKDRFVYAAGSKPVEATGGEETHTLTVAEMPMHNHGVIVYEDEKGAGAYFRISQQPMSVMHITVDGVPDSALQDVSGAICDRTSNVTSTDSFIANSGDNQPHNNMPPYIVAYCWRRTA